MTARIYRYARSLDVTQLQRRVNGTPTFNASSPLYVDVNGDDANTNQKANLDEYMKTLGYDYLSTDPGNTPTAAASAALGSGSYDSRDDLIWDHFITGSTTTARLGRMGWQVSSTGTGADVSTTAEAGHPGIVDLGAGTAAAARSAIYLGDSATLFNFLLSATQNQIDQEWLIRLNANSLAAANNERLVVGWGVGFDGSAGVELTSGVYLELDPNNSANFQLVTANSNTRTRTNSTIAATSDAWLRIGLRMTYPGGTPTASLLINGTVRGTATANIPTVPVGIGARIDANVTSNEARLQLDYCRVTQVTAKET